MSCLISRHKPTSKEIQKRKACYDKRSFKNDKCLTVDKFFPADYIYVSFDYDNKKICGECSVYFTTLKNKTRFVQIEAVNSRTYGDPTYKGKQIMVNLFNTIIQDAEKYKADFIYISGYSKQGICFYFKYGFKLIGTTGTLCLPLKRFPTISDLRYIEKHMTTVTAKNSFKIYNEIKRLHYSYKQDNEEKWKNLYCTFDDEVFSFACPDEPKEFIRKQSFVFPLSELKEMQKYPKWMYKFSKSKPSFAK